MGKTYEIGTKFNNILTKDVIESWGTDNIILNGATGSGKTFFVENNLHKYCKENFKNILFLCNRRALLNQVSQEVNELGLNSMEVMLYQTLQNKLRNKEEIEKYDYIVCDEFHYVLSDAMFNKYTDITYNYITTKENTCTIFMSGTAHSMFNTLKNKEIVKEENEYIIPYSYDYVTELQFYRKKHDVINIIKDKLENTSDKIIYFVNSTSFAMDVYKTFEKEAIFICSKHTKYSEARKLNNMKGIKKYSEDLITFNARLLVATKALDNGVSLRDRAIKHIISDIFDLESDQQSLGRKRPIDENDTCTFYIRKYTRKEIGGFKGKLNAQYIPLSMFVEDRDKYDDMYGNDREYHNDYIYSEGNQRIYNKLAYWKMICQGAEIDFMEQVGYKEVLLGRLGDTIKNVIDREVDEEIERKGILQEYLENIRGKKIYKTEREEFIEMVGYRNKNKRLIKTEEKIASHLEKKFDSKYKLISDTDWSRKLDDGSDNINYSKSYWLIQ